eukprot:scaffold2228_cov92-Cylindrotheca_fusiformis.AAC.2
MGVWGLAPSIVLGSGGLAPSGFKGQSPCGEDCEDNDSLFWVIQSVMVRVMREACNWKMMSLKELCPAKHAHQGSL